MDFFTTEVLTLKGLTTYHVLFFIHLESRQVKLAGFTPYPDQEWMEQQARNMSPKPSGKATTSTMEGFEKMQPQPSKRVFFELRGGNGPPPRNFAD